MWVRIICAAMLAVASAASVTAQDADDAYRDARRALNRQEFTAAIDAFQALRRDYPDARYVADSYYWEAFALERSGELQGAVAAVDTLLREHPEAATAGDARALRIRACSELARRGDGECAQLILETVRDPARLDEATRMAAVNALLNMRADRAIPIAAQVATNRGHRVAVRRQALFILADKAEDGNTETQSLARETLRTVALDAGDDPEVRSQAVFWLSKVPGEDTLAMLAELVNSEADVELKKRAIFAISEHESSESMSLLRELAGNGALNIELRKQAIFWIGEEGEDRAVPFLMELYSTLDSAELKRQVLFAVAEAEAAESVDWLIARAEDPAETVDTRRQALFWAAEAGLPATRLASLYDRFAEPEIREHLIWLIADTGGAGALESLLQIARTDPDPDMRAKAIFWIGDSDDPRAAEYLIELLEP